jgi:5-formyltetrahydrofolate cyclo-ligase
MGKDELRGVAKRGRDAFVAGLSPAQRCAHAVVMAQRIESVLGEARAVAVYLPIGSEADTLPLIDHLASRGVEIALPHVRGLALAMRFLRWSPGQTLVAGPFGLRQPLGDAPEIDPDVIVTPLLAFDSRLHRLGYGAGYYDRAFAAHPAARRIGIAWACQQVEALPDEAWDVPLHAVATEQDWITA